MLDHLRDRIIALALPPGIVLSRDPSQRPGQVRAQATRRVPQLGMGNAVRVKYPDCLTN